MKNPWEPERLTPRSRIRGPGSFRFWYASAERAVVYGRIAFEPGLHETLSWVIPGCHQINVGRRACDEISLKMPPGQTDE